MFRTGFVVLTAMTCHMAQAGEQVTSEAAAEIPVAEIASTSPEMSRVVMHKSPGCGCCAIWAEHLQAHGFEVESIADPDVQALKTQLGIQPEARSCHTALVGPYVIEGHVPAGDIARLLKEHPDNVKGLSVPGMPLGSPGMEHPNPQHFKTVALMKDGSYRLFAEHLPGEDFAPEAEKENGTD